MRSLIAAVLLLLLGTSCVTNKSTTYLQTDEKLPQYPKAPYTYYRIQKNDQLVIRLLSLNEEATAIFNLDNGSSSSSSSYTYRVYDDGTIDIPFVESIPVVGLTIREASKVIEARLKDFVPDAMVKVALANDKFYMLGVSGKGAYSLYKEKLNIFQALALTGTMATNADRKRVRLIRPNPEGGRPIVKQFDLRTISIIDSEYYYVQPNDVLYVGPIKGDFWKIENYSAAVGTLSTSLNFLVSVVNLGFSFR
jgi:polysaccharide export outer membrane protein